LQRIKNPDHIEVHRLEACPQCGGRGLGREPVLDYASRQVFDLPVGCLRAGTGVPGAAGRGRSLG
jgi:hypothetical protein